MGDESQHRIVIVVVVVNVGDWENRGSDREWRGGKCTPLASDKCELKASRGSCQKQEGGWANQARFVVVVAVDDDVRKGKGVGSRILRGGSGGENLSGGF